MSRPLVMTLFDLQPADMTQELYDTYDIVKDFAQAKAAQIALTSGTIGFTAAQMDLMPQLRLIAVFGVGVDAVDVAEAKRRGIIVSHTPDVLTQAVAELSLSLAFAVTRKIAEADAFLRQGRWAAGEKFPLSTSLLTRRAGILGYGRIGRHLADLLRGLGMTVAYTARSQKPDSPDSFHPDALSLAKDCDVLFVTAPGAPETRGLVNAEVLAALGAEGIVINVARGPLVDSEALSAALHSAKIAGAGLDVFDDEPNVPQSLLSAPNCVFTPHIGSATVQARRAMARLVLDNIAAFVAGAALPSRYEG